MSASVNDKFRIASGSTKPVVTSLSLPKSAGSTTAELTQATGWNTTTGLDYVMYRRQLNVATGQYEEQPGTRIEGIAELSGTTLSNMTITAGTEPVSGYAADGNTVILCSPTAQWADDLVGGILSFANQDATLKTSAVQAALGLGNATNTGFTPFGATMTYTGNNGNKEYTANIAADVTSFLPLGAKIAVTRGTAPPTQSMSFTASSNQYASKASPTGITFSSAFTPEAWIYLNSYSSNGDMDIISRIDSTAANGFIMSIDGNGRLRVIYRSSSSSTDQNSYQSIPLKRWVHVAASVTTSSKVINLYMNGTLLPSVQQSSSATTITQAGDLTMGARTGVQDLFNGYISEARLWANAQTQQQIRDNMNISLSGSETGLVYLAQGNGNFNDKTSNGNNLTATGGATATQAANPMNAVEYFKVTKVGTYSGGVTPLTLFGGTDCNLPNMTLTGAQYSNVDKPFGFPASKGKWISEVLIKSNPSISGFAGGTWTVFPGVSIFPPTGEWKLRYEVTFRDTSSSVGSKSSFYVLANFTPSNTTYTYDLMSRIVDTGSSSVVAGTYSRSKDITSTGNPAQDVYTLYGTADSINGTETLSIDNSAGTSRFIAEMAY